jgi:hypothetical protein
MALFLERLARRCRLFIDLGYPGFDIFPHNLLDRLQDHFLFLGQFDPFSCLFTNKVKLGIDDAGNRKPVTVKRGFRRIL